MRRHDQVPVRVELCERWVLVLGIGAFPSISVAESGSIRRVVFIWCLLPQRLAYFQVHFCDWNRDGGKSIVCMYNISSLERREGKREREVKRLLGNCRLERII